MATPLPPTLTPAERAILERLLRGSATNRQLERWLGRTYGWLVVHEGIASLDKRHLLASEGRASSSTSLRSSSWLTVWDRQEVEELLLNDGKRLLEVGPRQRMSALAG